MILNKLKMILRYYHTLKYLKLRQFFWRIRYRFFRNNTADLSPPPQMRDENGIWKLPAARRASMVANNCFLFLNQEGELNSVDDWQNHSSKLWLYNLHYFDDLNANGSSERTEWHSSLINQWINDNPPAKGEGWEPYPLSIRIINWIKWHLKGNQLTPEAIESLAIQTRWLTKRLEWHLLGNHLFINAKALVFAGCFFHGIEADKWLEKGIEILLHEIPEQILQDGGHFERSTMYHALAFEDMLDLYNISNRFPRAFKTWNKEISTWPEIIKKMGQWLKAMSHPDGEISFFNDAAIGIAPTPSEIFRYAEDLNIECADLTKEEVIWLRESGYIRINHHDIALIIDIAPVGPDYLPGHAHADTLSYELSINDKRIVINSGTSRYGLGAERERERSTAAHSTIEVDKENSSEVWAGFRVARRAYPLQPEVLSNKNEISVSCSHNGYLRLPGRVIHKRTWNITETQISILDQIDGKYSSATSRIFFHPEIKPDLNNLEGHFSVDNQQFFWNLSNGDPVLSNSKYSPEFGVQMDNVCLEINIDSPTVEFRIELPNSNIQNSVQEI
ncbi:MAG: heparinase [Gammaproteobacteria bacterium]|nr:MAG: heparinase [Gammaproteobacteria bacterium]